MRQQLIVLFVTCSATDALMYAAIITCITLPYSTDLSNRHSVRCQLIQAVHNSQDSVAEETCTKCACWTMHRCNLSGWTKRFLQRPEQGAVYPVQFAKLCMHLTALAQRNSRCCLLPQPLTAAYAKLHPQRPRNLIQQSTYNHANLCGRP